MQMLRLNNYLVDLNAFLYCEEIDCHTFYRMDNENVGIWVTFSVHFESSAHVTSICDNFRRRNKFLKALADSTWRIDEKKSC